MSGWTAPSAPSPATAQGLAAWGRTIGSCIAEARTLVQDKIATSAVPPGATPSLRYTDAEMMEAFNAAMASARTLRPDLFLDIGLRVPVPLFSPGDFTQPFPLDASVYNAFVFYLAGRAELREDTFSDDSRAVNLMAKFTAQLLGVQG